VGRPQPGDRTYKVHLDGYDWTIESMKPRTPNRLRHSGAAFGLAPE